MSGAAIKTGFFVLSGVVLFFFVWIVIAKLNLFTSNSKYTVRFSVTDGITGLAKGSDVQVGGLSRGKVSEIIPKIGDDGALLELHVVINLDENLRVYEDAAVLRIMTLLGSTATLNFTSLGGEKPLIEPGSDVLIQAMPSSGVLAAILGPYNATKADQIIQDLLDFGDLLARVPKDYDTKVLPILDNAGSIAADLRTDYSEWRGKIGGALTSAQGAMGKLDTSMGDVQGLLQRNAPKIDTTIANLDSASATANDALKHISAETVPLVDSALRKAESAVDGFGKSIDIVHDLLLQRSPDISEMLSNLRTTASQLKLASMEVRRSPWKILYQPNSEQVAHENLYEAARSFVLAAGDLRAAGESLRLVVERDPGRYETDTKFRESVQLMVTDALAKYEQAQQQLNSVLLSPAPAGESKAR
jgi:ABC-type transporter Mla subunit MlaD